jgi:hypothetical protein
VPITTGDTFLIQTGSPTNPNANHLVVALTDIPIDASGRILFVTISSVKTTKTHDKTCEIFAADGAHPFITRDSFVDYSIVHQLTPATMLQRAILGADGNPARQRLPDDLVRRIRQGVFDSPRAGRFARDDLTKCQRLEQRRFRKG